jgi:hypothetical protein
MAWDFYSYCEPQSSAVAALGPVKVRLTFANWDGDLMQVAIPR